ncbi:MAG: hypothetical protein HQL84_02190 [Magnetococcales bacterium]|nr:hypothetical protein [Magnetococcales bacterium]MBF0148837.1 hypothetical protein [Magnetococcales bacterium]MBF0173160.1 hypothetical protein [Magnetococcales bacterium]
MKLLWVVILMLGVGVSMAGEYPDPAKFSGPDACGSECHKGEVAVWKETRHALTFKEMETSEKGREIAEKMGVKRPKTADECAFCHFTRMVVDGKVQVTAGPTCESCHGAGRDWIKIHGDYGGKDVKKEDEKPEHKAQRLEQSLKGGLIPPKDLYLWVRNCFSCHLGHDEKLVNVGGHTPGSNIELVSWTQGKPGKAGSIRHNVFYTKDNQPASVERRRLIFVVGLMTEIEYGLRAIGKATQKDTFATKMARRVKTAWDKLQLVSQAVEIKEVKELLAGTAAIEKELKLNNSAPLNQLADKVGVATKTVAQGYDGKAWAAVDGMIPYTP